MSLISVLVSVLRCCSSMDPEVGHTVGWSFPNSQVSDKTRRVIKFTITGSEEIVVDEPFPFDEERRYIITTPFVYKSSSAYNAVEDKNSLYTSRYGTICGVGLQVGTTYIIAGYISGGTLRIGLCSPLYKPVGQFTPDQLRNLQSGYASGCSNCNIQYRYCANQEECDKIRPLTSRKTCIANQDLDGLQLSCRDKYAVCVRRRGFWWYDAGCHWVATSGSLRTCLRQQNGK